MNIRAQINYWLALKQYDYRKLADEMSKLSGRKYTRGSINGKLVRNTLTVQELELIAKILGYKIDFTELQNKKPPQSGGFFMKYLRQGFTT